MSSAVRERTGPRLRRPGQSREIDAAEHALQYSWLNLFANGVLTVVKIVVGILSGSRALVASAMYSVNNAFSAIVVVVSTRYARRRPDEDYAYGYGNAEYVAVGIVSTVVTGAVVLLLAIHIFDILRGGHTAPHPAALLVAGAALMTNYYLAMRGRQVAAETNSPIAGTAAQHNSAEVWGSILAIVGIGGATIGFYVIDPLFALLQILHLVFLAGSLFGPPIRGLMDVALPPAHVLAAADAVASVDGVGSVISVRTRQSGAFAWVDAEVELEQDVPIARAHEICRMAAAELDAALPYEVRTQVKFRVHGQQLRDKPISQLEAAIAEARRAQGVAGV